MNSEFFLNTFRRSAVIWSRSTLTIPATSGTVGPIFILNTFTEALGDYLADLVTLSFRTAAFRDGKWLGSWTIFYWAWWVSWAPFVGVFIARISKGRTIREFVIGVLLVPSGVTFLWFTIMGGTALHSELMGGGGLSRR